MTTPYNDSNSFGTTSTGGTGSTGSTGSTASTGSTSNRGTDDVSFGTSAGYAAGNSGAQQGNASGQGSAETGTMDSIKDTVSDGMHSAGDALGQLQSKATELTSKLLNNVDVDDLVTKLEGQVRAHPTRTLLVALGAGFLLGRSAKR